VAKQDARNRTLCRAREEPALAHDEGALTDAGRSDVARKVCSVSEEDDDGAGYDIESYAQDGRPCLIEGMTTNAWERRPFRTAPNELAVAEARRADLRLMRLWSYSREPMALQLHPSLNAHASLAANRFHCVVCRSPLPADRPMAFRSRRTDPSASGPRTLVARPIVSSPVAPAMPTGSGGAGG
jgi:Domain of unknown function (DUF3883)